MSMQASRAMSGWAADAPPPFTGTPLTAGQSAEERFETEALPHLNDLFRTALRLTGERGQAEDVMQEVYLQAWRSFDRFEAGTNCRAWLYKILFDCVRSSAAKVVPFPPVERERRVP